MKKGDKIYITKYALTAGIKTAIADNCYDTIVIVREDFFLFLLYRQRSLH